MNRNGHRGEMRRMSHSGKSHAQPLGRIAPALGPEGRHRPGGPHLAAVAPAVRQLRPVLPQGQYFSGYAETLLSFDHREEAFRLGVAMLR